MKTIMIFAAFFSLSSFAFSDKEICNFICERDQIDELFDHYEMQFKNASFNFTQMATEVNNALLAPSTRLNKELQNAARLIREHSAYRFFMDIIAINDNTKKTISSQTISHISEHRANIGSTYRMKYEAGCLNKVAKYIIAFYYFNEFEEALEMPKDAEKSNLMATESISSPPEELFGLDEMNIDDIKTANKPSTESYGSGAAGAIFSAEYQAWQQNGAPSFLPNSEYYY